MPRTETLAMNGVGHPFLASQNVEIKLRAFLP